MNYKIKVGTTLSPSNGPSQNNLVEHWLSCKLLIHVIIGLDISLLATVSASQQYFEDLLQN